MVQRVSEVEQAVASDLQQRIATVCQSVTPTDGFDALLPALQGCLPGLELSHVKIRAGWHRLGGVVDVHGERVAQHIRDWVDAVAGDDLDGLLDRLTSAVYFATRLNGQTHYLVAPTGPNAGDFIQLEIEELQEVLSHSLSDPDWMPDSIADVVDPHDLPLLEPEPVGPPRLQFRRLLRVGDFLDSGAAGPRLRRFLADWDGSSAAESAAFCHHWILAIREYQDRDGSLRATAKPVSVHDSVPALADAEIARGAMLANQIHGFDREVGYHFAWYFHMLADRRVSHRIAEAVHADLMGAYDYLPARDLRVLRAWYQDPYGI